MTRENSSATKNSVPRAAVAAARWAAGLLALGLLAAALASCNQGLFTPFAKSFLQVMPLRRNYHFEDYFDKEADLRVYLQEPGDIDIDDADLGITVGGIPLDSDTTRLCLDWYGERSVVVTYREMSAKYSIYVVEEADNGDSGGGLIIIINGP